MKFWWLVSTCLAGGGRKAYLGTRSRKAYLGTRSVHLIATICWRNCHFVFATLVFRVKEPSLVHMK